MKYKLGDFVRFVDEKMEGFVTRIIDDQMIGVTGEDDFEIPVLASKVTTVYGYEAAGTKKDNVIEELPAITGTFKTNGVFLGAVNDPKVNSVVHFYLINDTSFQLLASFTTEKEGYFKGVFSRVLPPGSATKIHSAQIADLQVWPEFIFQVLFYTTTNVASPAPIVANKKFNAKHFSGTKRQLPLINPAVQGWLIQLDKAELLIDAQKLKESFFRPTEEKAILEKPGHEIDMHIEILRNDHQFLVGSEILGIQLDYFHKMLDAAIVHQLPEVIFIHGSGNGTLKHEIHKILSKHQKVQTFMDARKEKFGYGATKVILK